jgi:predicted Rossmann fold flavoprotein
MLITHWGLSGPAVLKLSAWGAILLHSSNYKAELLVNFMPEYNQSHLSELLSLLKTKSPKKLVQNANELPIPSRYWKKLVEHCGIESEMTWANLSRDKQSLILTELSEAKFQIRGKGIFKEEFVTCGGVSLKEIDFKTMQSRISPGIYFAGEVLDIDGITGGFNFQSAWTTGWIAGNSVLNQ